MNIEKLKELEDNFLSIYPDAFDSEDMKEVKKKHKIYKLQKYLLEVCSKENLTNGKDIISDITKFITRSSMISVFEKVKFKDIMKELSEDEHIIFVQAIKELLYGNEEEGFNHLVYVLKPYKLAKWSIISAFKAYYNLNTEVFIKPTTVKKIIRELELDDMIYHPTPDFHFYKKFRDYINEMKTLVDPRLSSSNPAFTGFLMYMIE